MTDETHELTGDEYWWLRKMGLHETQVIKDPYFHATDYPNYITDFDSSVVEEMRDKYGS